MSFNNFNAFINAQLLYNISNILFVLIVNYFLCYLVGLYYLCMRDSDYSILHRERI